MKPTVAITGHGLPMMGDLLTDSLRKLVQEFDRIAIPDYGIYIEGIVPAYMQDTSMLGQPTETAFYSEQ